MKGAPMSDATALREEVREKYAEAARSVGSGGSCCGDSCCGGGEAASFGAELYGSEVGELPDAAALASLGCGNPTAVAELREGETVLDLGSGGGIDVLLSAKRVGPTGIAYGLDMTEEMLALARRNATDAGARNVEFLKGHIEAIPLPAATVDVVISNCVINLLSRPARGGGFVGRAPPCARPGRGVGAQYAVGKQAKAGEVREPGPLGDPGQDWQ